ncbi:MAG: ATP-dependent DNA helicase RecG [Clostridia bacterium]|nr:ATP-dependent DNA helicase RecG [Clostridia bacterium]
MRLTDLKFISDKREKDFSKLNIHSVEELVRLYPRDYLDLTKAQKISSLYHNSIALVQCEVLSVESRYYSRRPHVKAVCRQGDNYFEAIWFNQPYVASKLQRADYLFYGRVQNKYGMGVTMVNPTFELADSNKNLKGIIPVYPLSGGLTQKVVRDAIRQGLQKIVLSSVIPAGLRAKYSLMPLPEAYSKVHKPETQDDITEGASRVALEEYFLLISAFKIIKGDGKTVRLNSYTVTERETAGFMRRFPFEFTAGQRAAVRDIYDDVHSPVKMNRLLQGDVGSGKTAVALTGIYMAVKSGYQAAMIAPTEVLARQNFALLQKYFPDFEVCLLTGSTTAAEKKAVKAALKSGAASIVCGTHAVIQKDVGFDRLAFVVCDEQHRFGVAQRASLSEKGEGCDVLIMSATPIPRTLSLIFYGDLDISTIKDKPAARQEISTSIIPASKYDDMLLYIARQAKEGRQSYFVCPKIEGDDEGTVMSVTELYEELKLKMRGVRLALLHGKMKDAQKNQIMADFKAKKYDCLVSTTVIEVGVDVPDATVMVIYNAEMFGLSQLHQLRGRVGRGSQKSYCFLLLGSDTPQARERLSVIKNNSDGFKIAEYDLEMRGSGDFMGTRQSGRVLTEIKNLKFPASVIFTAKAIADEAFSGAYDVTLLKKLAMEKYDSLKDVVLN